MTEFFKHAANNIRLITACVEFARDNPDKFRDYLALLGKHAIIDVATQEEFDRIVEINNKLLEEFRDE